MTAAVEPSSNGKHTPEIKREFKHAEVAAG
jgi:hypothetical protein